MTEVKEKVKADPKKYHHLIDWVLLTVALTLILGGAGLYLLSEFNVINIELGDKYREEIFVPTKKGDLSATNDVDVKAIDNEINSVSAEDFNDKGLNNSNLGL